MRSIWSTGMSWNDTRPAVAEPMRTPSTSTSTWSDSVPRRNSVLILPGPPWLPKSMPARPRSRSGRLRAWLRSMSSRSITCTGNRLSAADVEVRVAVTTTSSRSDADCADAMAGKASAMAKDRERRCMETDSGAHARAQGIFGSRVRKSVQWPSETDAAAMPAASQPVRSVAGLRTRERTMRDAWSRSWRLPVRCTVADASTCLAYRCGGSAGMATHVGAASPASRFNPLANAFGSPRSAGIVTRDHAPHPHNSRHPWRSPFGPASLFAGAPAPAVGTLARPAGLHANWRSQARSSAARNPCSPPHAGRGNEDQSSRSTSYPGSSSMPVEAVSSMCIVVVTGAAAGL